MRSICIIILVLQLRIAYTQPNDICKPWILDTEITIPEKPSVRFDFEASYNYDVFYVNAFFELDTSIRYIKGKIEQHIRTKKNTKHITFDINDDLLINKLTINGIENKNFERLSNRVIIELDSIVNINTTLQLNFDYEGTPPNHRSFSKTYHNNIPVIWTLSQPYSASNWWICKQALDDKIDSIDISIAVNKNVTAVANGLLIKHISSDSSEVYYYKHRYPIASYLVAIAATNYENYEFDVRTLNNDTIKIINYLYPEYIEQGKKSDTFSARMLIVFDSLFGRYPFYKEQYGHAQFGFSGGMEHQTISFMANLNFNLLAHELGHQWFGDAVTCGSWSDIWLNEGFGRYSEALASEYLPQYAPNNPATLRQIYLNSIVNNPPNSIYTSDTVDVRRIFSGIYSYNKAAFAIHEFRKWMGDSTFFAMLKSYLNNSNQKFRFSRTQDFAQKAEEFAGEDAKTLVNQWIFNNGIPNYSIYYQQDNNKLLLKIKQETISGETEFWYQNLFINISSNELDTTLSLKIKSNISELSIPINQNLTNLLIDPNPEYQNLALFSVINKDILKNKVKIYPNPTRDKFFIETSYDVTNNLSYSMYSIEGKMILSENNVSKNKVEIDISSFPQNIYLLEVFHKNNVATFKILKM
jgi:aminopeptidase N